MTVVDVNTGKYTGSGGNLEETVTRNNLEAAEEIVRQLRLRDIGGIIVVDFIDMVLESNRELVLRRLTECLGRDRTRHQVAEVTSLGLVQMTRKRMGTGLLEAFSEPCPHCGGRGIAAARHARSTTAPARSEDGDGGRRRRPAPRTGTRPAAERRRPRSPGSAAAVAPDPRGPSRRDPPRSPRRRASRSTERADDGRRSGVADPTADERAVGARTVGGRWRRASPDGAVAADRSRRSAVGRRGSTPAVDAEAADGDSAGATRRPEPMPSRPAATARPSGRRTPAPVVVRSADARPGRTRRPVDEASPVDARCCRRRAAAGNGHRLPPDRGRTADAGGRDRGRPGRRPAPAGAGGGCRPRHGREPSARRPASVRSRVLGLPGRVRPRILGVARCARSGLCDCPPVAVAPPYRTHRATTIACPPAAPTRRGTSTGNAHEGRRVQHVRDRQDRRQAVQGRRG